MDGGSQDQQPCRSNVPNGSEFSPPQSQPSWRLPTPHESQARASGRITATAHKIAIIFYTLVTKQIEYDDSIWATRDEHRQKRFEQKNSPRIALTLSLRLGVRPL
jgi:hypothetical protein